MHNYAAYATYAANAAYATCAAYAAYASHPCSIQLPVNSDWELTGS